MVKHSNSDHSRSKLITFRSLSLLLIFTSSCLIISQIIGISSLDHQDSTNMSYWDHIYTSLNLLSLFTLLIGLVGISIFQYNKCGRFSEISFFLAFFVTALIAGDAWFEAFVVPFVASESPQLMNKAGVSMIIGASLSFSTFSIGWIMVGISSLRTKIIPKYISILIICGGIFGFQALTPPYFGVLGIAIGILGVWMYSESSIRHEA